MRRASSDPDRWADVPRDIPGLFGLERHRLVELLGGLDPGHWLRPTPCPGWSVLGLCAHLLGDDLGWLARHRDRHHGTPAPAAVDEDDFIRWLDDLQDQWVRATRRHSPRVVLDLLTWTGPQIVAALADQDPARVDGSVSWADIGPVPVWLDQLREVSEQWIHRQQLLQALGRPSDLRADLAAPVLGALRWAYPHRLRTITATDGATVTIRITGPVTRTWHLVSDPDGWRYRPEPGSHIVATMDLTTEQAWRVLTNNFPTEQHQSLVTSADRTITDTLLRTRAIIGAPNYPAAR